MRANHTNYNSQKSLTDDLPVWVCKNAGIGFSTNQIYREDGSPQEAHVYEDCSSHFEFKDDSYWYTVFDGYEGKKAANFCSQQMTTEIVFGNLNKGKSDEEIKEMLRQAFITVEKSYIESLGDLLAERTSILFDIPCGMSIYEYYKNNPRIIDRLRQINYELSSGTAAAVALIYNKKLFVANIGNCRVLLCQTDANSVLKVVQLSIDHDLKNEDEILRLTQLGINTNSSRNNSLGNQGNTRCLGNYLVKGGYKDFEDLNSATQEPIIAEPDVHGGIVLDDSCRFLLLMSAGLYQSVEEVTGNDQVNKFIAQCIVEQFREQGTLGGVAQAVVDKVVRLHRDYNSISSSLSRKREDITLVLRNFNYPLPNAITPTTNSSVAFSPIVLAHSSSSFQDTSTNASIPNSTVNSNTVRTDDTSSSDERTANETAGKDHRVEPYVDFTEFTRNFEIARRSGMLPKGINF